MSFSLDDIYADLDSFLNDTVFPGQAVHEQAVSDITVLERFASGAVKPYIAVQYGDLQQWGSTSFVGPMGDDYVLPVYLKIVVAGDESATGIPLGKQLYSQCIQRFLGASFDWAGQIRKRAGGAQIPIKKSTGAVEALVIPVSFGIVIQLTDVPDLTTLVLTGSSTYTPGGSITLGVTATPAVTAGGKIWYQPAGGDWVSSVDIPIIAGSGSVDVSPTGICSYRVSLLGALSNTITTSIPV
ncbi:MAG: hypothetical protein M0R66_02700 [Candidatus Omnitrophica bacterium]|nr:hypothetical protein [Candidatus Omnitrophota bacterium]